MKNFISFVVLVISFALLFYASYKSSQISNDKAVYKYSNNNLIVDYVNPSSNVYRAGMHIGDKILYVNEEKILNRHVLHNLVFDRTTPGDTLHYTIERDDSIVSFSAVAERRFSLPKLMLYLIFGLIYSIFTMFFFNSFAHTKTKIYLYLFFLCLSLLMSMFNVPFSHRILYSSMMVITTVLSFSILQFSHYYLYEFSVKWPLRILSSFVILSSLLWIASYFKWTYTLFESDYSHLMLYLRFSQISMALVAIYSIVSIFIKTLKMYVTKQPKEYFITSFVLLFILVLYPVLYGLPFALRKKELLPFSIFFYMFFLFLVFIVIYKKRLARVFL